MIYCINYTTPKEKGKILKPLDQWCCAKCHSSCNTFSFILYTTLQKKRPNKDGISDRITLISDGIFISVTELATEDDYGIFACRLVPGDGILKFRRNERRNQRWTLQHTFLSGEKIGGAGSDGMKNSSPPLAEIATDFPSLVAMVYPFCRHLLSPKNKCFRSVINPSLSF